MLPSSLQSDHSNIYVQIWEKKSFVKWFKKNGYKVVGVKIGWNLKLQQCPQINNMSADASCGIRF